VNPGEDVVWTLLVMEVTGMSKNDRRTATTQKINGVWTLFCDFIKNNIAANEMGAVMAYNGAGTNMKLIWLLT
jgi:hypothetical protein